MKKIFQYGYLMFVFLLTQHHVLFSQGVKFNKAIPNIGVNFSPVTDIAQDKYGFIWVATKHGLLKYDGTKLTTFEYNPEDPNSLSGNILTCLTIDRKGMIWVGGLTTGLNRFDPTTEKFTRFLPNPDDPKSIMNDTINDILMDREGKLWIATQQGLDLFNATTNSFTHYQSDRNDPTTISDRQVRVLYEDRQGTLWVGTGSPFSNNGGTPMDGGLCRYNREKGTFTRYEHIPLNDQSLISNKISALYEDNDGIFWVGTAHTGLHQMNRKQGTFKRILYNPQHPEKFSIPPYAQERTDRLDVITFITQDTTGGYWLGTLRQGLFYYDIKKNQMFRFPDPTREQNVFTDVRPRATLTSNDGVFWIGSNEGNLYHYNPLQRKIQHTNLNAEAVSYFFEDQNESFWIGTGKGLIKIDPNTRDTTHFTSAINFSTTKNDRILGINTDQTGNVWVAGTIGLYSWNAENHTFTGFLPDPKNSKSISDTNVVNVYEDRSENFWVATFRGLNLMDRKTGLFKHFWVNPADTTNNNENLISHVFEDNAGNLWVGSWNGGGLHIFDRQRKTFTKNYLPRSSIVRIYEDSQNVLWIGTRDGLFRYKEDVDNFIRYSNGNAASGFSEIYSLLEDDQQNLWMSTPDQIVRLNPQRNETSIYEQNFGVENLRRFAALKDKSGKIYFGNSRGYYSFEPESFLSNLPSPKILITDFRISDELIRPDKKGPLKKDLQETNEIRLTYNQNVFSFDFTIFDYVNPSENRLQYYLENYDQDWIQANSARRAYYFNVPAGKYIFHLKGANSYGIWAEKKIVIHVMPPWYLTWLAYVIYGLLFIAGLFVFDRTKRKLIIKKERLRSQERELAQAKEIEKAYTELKATQSQLIQSEKMASLGELTAGIAHEIQNPLNFVNNFAEVSSELVDEMNEELENGDVNEAKSIGKDIKQNLDKINHHGKRAEGIVKGMLLHSRGSSGEKEPTDITALADEYLRLSYHGYRAKDKSFNADFKLEADEKLPKLNVIPQDIGRVLLNLINNAFYVVNEKAKKENSDYKPMVTVSTKLLKDKLEIKVKDNGNGIPDAVKEKIFQPFFTTKPTGQGTGLGLSLSYDIVKAHGGELNVVSETGNWTEFIITLPRPLG